VVCRPPRAGVVKVPGVLPRLLLPARGVLPVLSAPDAPGGRADAGVCCCCCCCGWERWRLRVSVRSSTHCLLPGWAWQWDCGSLPAGSHQVAVCELWGWQEGGQQSRISLLASLGGGGACKHTGDRQAATGMKPAACILT
jgi:hypothetical protein